MLKHSSSLESDTENGSVGSCIYCVCVISGSNMVSTVLSKHPQPALQTPMRLDSWNFHVHVWLRWCLLSSCSKILLSLKQIHLAPLPFSWMTLRRICFLLINLCQFFHCLGMKTTFSEKSPSLTLNKNIHKIVVLKNIPLLNNSTIFSGSFLMAF